MAEIKETLSNLKLGLSLDLHPKLIERIQNELREDKRRKESAE